jgi:hypothetical protein
MNYKYDENGFYSGMCTAPVGNSTLLVPPEPFEKFRPRWVDGVWVLTENWSGVTWFNPEELVYETSSSPDDNRQSPWVEVIGGRITEEFSPTSGFVFNYVTKKWVDPRSLSKLKADRWELIKKARNDAEFGGFLWDGSRFDSDQISQQRIQGMVQIANLDSSMSMDWTLADNSVRTLNSEQGIALGLALAAHVNEQHVKARTLRVAIDSATSAEQVAAVVWGL